MRGLRQLWLSVAIVLLGAGFAVGADLESAKRAYQQQNYTAALKELAPLAEKGDAQAQILLGRMYLTGRGVLNDPDTAIKWFKAAAAQGNADGAFLLGSMYLVPHSNIAEGLRWVRLAAEQGNQDAQLLLGKTYLDGLPELPPDPVQAELWLRLAAKDNLPFYEAQLTAAERSMSPAQIAKGKALAAAWKPTPGLKPGDKPGSTPQ